MRLVTRSDFDGLACAVLLKSIGLITEYKFAHPKDLQDGLVEATWDDILANVPYVEGCAMWFDHHSSEHERLGDVTFKGSSKPLPSCARVIWEYFGGHNKFPAHLDAMMTAVDKMDSGALSHEDILNPTGWVMLGFIMDPRTGLGRYHDYRISNYQLMVDMIGHCLTKTADEMLALPDIVERVERYQKQQSDFAGMLKRRAVQHDNVVLVDLRDEEEIFSGNRFTEYAMYPSCNVSMRVLWGLKRRNVVITVGHSIVNRSCTADVGSLMLSCGGGGHYRVGSCQVPVEEAEQTVQSVLAALRGK